MSFELVIDGRMMERLRGHLFQPDRDEHAAIVLAGVDRNGALTRLLGRELHRVPAESFAPGQHGYRQIVPRFVAEQASRAADEGLAYVAVHSHPGATGAVALSRDDRAAHARLFPHLADLTKAPVVGIALGTHSASGEVWTGRDAFVDLDSVRVIGPALEVLRASQDTAPAGIAARFDRQARLFGAAGQRILGGMKVTVVGAGGGGSMLIEQLAHLGVGALTVIDFDVIKDVNLSRIVGATKGDACERRKKIDVLRRLVKTIAPECVYTGIDGDFNDLNVVETVLDTDFIFLATDTMSSRLVLNAVVHQYLIPAIQIGAKVDLRPDHAIGQIYVAVRPVFPSHGCLYCNSLIEPMRLQAEYRTAEEEVAQNYLNEPEIVDPSVVSLNGIAASHAVTTMLLVATGLAEPKLLDHRLFFPSDGQVLTVHPRHQPDCPFCGESSQTYARGGSPDTLPVRRSGVAGDRAPDGAAAGVRRTGALSTLRRLLRRFR